KPELLARLMSDRHGNLPPTAVLPHFGLIPHRGPHRRFRLHDEAELDLGGRAFSLRAIPTKSESKGSSEARFAITGASRNPQVFPCDSGGRLVTSFVRGEADILVGLRNFLPGCLRIFAVTRQFGWRPGDPLEPARDASSQPVSLTVWIDREGLTTVRLLSREHVREGSYQFVARHFSPGWYDADNDRLLAGDVLSNRRISSLVVRLAGKSLGWPQTLDLLAARL